MILLQKLKQHVQYVRSVIYRYYKYEQLSKELQKLLDELQKDEIKLPDILSQLIYTKEVLKEYVNSLPDEDIKEKGGGIISIINIIQEISPQVPECTKKLSSIQLYISESPANINPDEAKKLIIETINACLNPIIKEGFAVSTKLRKLFENKK